MQATSDLHKSIFADFSTCQMEYKAVIDGVEYSKDEIEAISTPVELYPSSGSAVGRCVSREIDLTVWLKDGITIPRAAEVSVFVRLVKIDGSGAVQAAAEWLPKGVYYIDTRESDTLGETLSMHGYDVLYARARKQYRTDGTTGEWPRTMQAVVDDIAARLGVTVDARTVINQTYKCDYPNDLTMWEVLQYIAAAHGGNWMTTDAGALRLIPYKLGEAVADIGQEMIDWSSQPAFDAYSRVTVWWDDEHAYTAGDDTGRVLEIDCPWATQAMADNLLAALGGYAYQPYEATEAVVDPAVEVGDTITANGVTSVIGSYDLQYDALQMSTIAAPGDRDEDHELGDYQGTTSRELARKVTLGAYYYGASITREKGLQIQKTNGENVAGEVVLNADEFAMRALIDGTMQDCIYFDPVEGRYRIAGTVIVDGGLSVDTLYAQQGDVAMLTVDWLDTSHKIKRYLEQDTSDDNHIVIHDQRLQFVTGFVVLDDAGNPVTEQLCNRYGAPLYWMKDISGATIQDGYPHDENGDQIMTTTEQTEWPVVVYQYQTYTKREITFDDSEAKVPLDTYGAGYGHEDPNRGKGYIQKATNSFDLWLLNSNGEKIGAFFGDQFADITGLRKTTELDFSGWGSGSFTEKVDGKDAAYSYGVEFDSSGRPVKITDADGHATTIKW